MKSWPSQYTYQNGGIYTVTVTVNDGQGGTASSTTTAVVQGVGVVNGTLFIIGTPGRDHVNLKFSEKKNELKVDVKLNQTGGSDGCSDGGSDGDILIGGTGKDKLKGGRGNDLLIGGSAAHEEDFAALDQTLAAWSSDDLTAALNFIGTITDDNEKDDLFGEQGDDSLHSENGDK